MKIKINGLNINYLSVGEGFPVLCLHGYALDHRVMMGCLEPIFNQVDSQWQRIYIDLPGMGESEVDHTVNNADDMLEVLVEFINHVIPNQNFVISSESYETFYRLPNLLFVCHWLFAVVKTKGGFGSNFDRNHDSVRNGNGSWHN